jgi:hypothetical protein
VYINEKNGDENNDNLKIYNINLNKLKELY